MRHALHTLAVVAPAWLRARTPPEWVDRYAARMENYRLPSDEAARYAFRIGPVWKVMGHTPNTAKFWTITLPLFWPIF